MFGRRSEEERGTTRSGKIYRVDTRKRYHGKYLETFIETNYIPLLSGSESEESLLENPKVTTQYSTFRPESLGKPKSSNNQGAFGFPSNPTLPSPSPYESPSPSSCPTDLQNFQYNFLRVYTYFCNR